MLIEDARKSSTGRDLLQRWDAQQTAYIKHRDLRFQAMVQAVSSMHPSAPRVLDLACGPGSLTLAVLDAIPDAQIVAVDKDPLLLAIARDVLGSNERVRIVDADLDEPSWTEVLGEPFDAVLSSTALHWLQPDILSRVYFQLADLIRPGGIFLNADHLYYDDTSQPTFRRMAKADDEANQQAAFETGTDTWEAWWEAAEAHPPYAEAVAKRARLWEGKRGPTPKVTLGYHLETLRSAGFAEVGTVWQYLDDHVVCAIR